MRCAWGGMGVWNGGAGFRYLCACNNIILGMAPWDKLLFPRGGGMLITLRLAPRLRNILIDEAVMVIIKWALKKYL